MHEREGEQREGPCSRAALLLLLAHSGSGSRVCSLIQCPRERELLNKASFAQVAAREASSSSSSSPKIVVQKDEAVLEVVLCKMKHKGDSNIVILGADSQARRHLMH